MAIAFGKMTVQRRTVLIAMAVFLRIGKISAIFCDALLAGTELSSKNFADSAARVSTSYAIDNAQIRHLLSLIAK